MPRQTRAELAHANDQFKIDIEAAHSARRSMGADLGNARRAIAQYEADLRRSFNRLHEAERTIVSQAHELAEFRRVRVGAPERAMSRIPPEEGRE